ncbi:MAG TPA: GntR family transcriptional regulator [Vicinamibacteria bacterium]|nr:GntR family transcriptional regulator [Vicinamibacteria bacterium]
MDFILNRRAEVSVRDQLMAQLELKILSGALEHGQRLPSVRVLARRLKVHHNTVSAAYQDLAAAGHVELRRGSGVFVRRAGPSALSEARGLDEMIRLALHTAFRQGYSGGQIRAAVERWLAAAPPDRLLVVDPCREMAELIVFELQQILELPAQAAEPEEVEENPGLLAGALTLVLPYHLEKIRRLVPQAPVEEVTLEISSDDKAAAEALPAGSVVLIVSHSPTVLPFATAFAQSLRGDELLIEARTLDAAREWKRLLRVADLVFADALSVETVSKARPRRLRELRIISEAALLRLKDALTIVAPHPNRVAPAALSPERDPAPGVRRA